MNKINEYMMVEGEGSDALVARVNLLIQDGYQPFGNPIQTEHGRWWYQAMVKILEK